MDVMSFDVRAVTENSYDATVEEMRKLAGTS
jgi:heme/copper-type cytochrome/quinol oxidase subunit 2